MGLSRMSPSLHSLGLLALFSATKLTGTAEDINPQAQTTEKMEPSHVHKRPNTDVWWPPSFISHQGDRREFFF